MAKTEVSDEVDTPQGSDELENFFDGSKYKYSLKEKAFVPKKAKRLVMTI